MAGGVGIELFGRDHWSTFGYIETRCVDHGGELLRQHMRCCPIRHPGLAHMRDEVPPTRLAGGVDKHGHDDWDCADDLEAAGLLSIGGTGMHPVFKMTAEGMRVAGLLRAHKAAGGSFSTFALAPATPEDPAGGTTKPE